MDFEQLGDIVQLKLYSEDADAMIVEVSDKEIKYAMFDIESSKASCPDGYTSCFFKKAWSHIGNDICKAIREFFTKGKMLGEVNTTLISLVPKVDTPNKISNFKQIACCNVLYKCISKILTNRIKLGLNKVVSINQSAFIPERHIQDNILITQELLRGYNRMQGSKRCAMKIDIQKAYDTVSWKNFEDVLGKVGFHKAMINWFMTCISTASFSICVNGKAKVAWSMVCRPKDQGGLGIKPLHKWNEIWPDEWVEEIPELQQISIPNIDDSAKDNVYWVNSENKELEFCTKVAWLSLRDNGPQIQWSNVIKVRGKLGNADSSMYRVVEKISKKPSNSSIWRILQRLVVSAVVYYIRQERNKRLFQDEKRSIEDLSKSIEENIESMLKSLNVKKSKVVLSVAKDWGLQWCQNRFIKVIGLDGLSVPHRFYQMALGGSGIHVFGIVWFFLREMYHKEGFLIMKGKWSGMAMHIEWVLD
ncbi:RNA-directed DNA polymerase, eukaryota, reverse transcriptase zinc-binding domain protein [Tanacetum coccineum]